jgi:hypothetical protein
MRVIITPRPPELAPRSGYRDTSQPAYNANANVRSGRFFIFSADKETWLNLFNARRD